MSKTMSVVTMVVGVFGFLGMVFGLMDSSKIIIGLLWLYVAIDGVFNYTERL